CARDTTVVGGYW
nr:immunoglobulin heavy chain junction region [Mus musculus]